MVSVGVLPAAVSCPAPPSGSAPHAPHTVTTVVARLYVGRRRPGPLRRPHWAACRHPVLPATHSHPLDSTTRAQPQTLAKCKAPPHPSRTSPPRSPLPYLLRTHTPCGQWRRAAPAGRICQGRHSEDCLLQHAPLMAALSLNDAWHLQDGCHCRHVSVTAEVRRRHMAAAVALRIAPGPTPLAAHLGAAAARRLVTT